jgi:hypothetical protein
MLKELFLNSEGRPFQRSRLFRFDICRGDDYIFAEHETMGIVVFSHGSVGVYVNYGPLGARHTV